MVVLLPLSLFLELLYQSRATLLLLLTLAGRLERPEGEGEGDKRKKKRYIIFLRNRLRYSHHVNLVFEFLDRFVSFSDLLLIAASGDVEVVETE